MTGTEPDSHQAVPDVRPGDVWTDGYGNPWFAVASQGAGVLMVPLADTGRYTIEHVTGYGPMTLQWRHPALRDPRPEQEGDPS